VAINRYEFAKWDALARSWNHFLSPCRPDKEDLDAVLKMIQGSESAAKSTLKVLILGSTPEFRDIAQSPDTEITVVDQNSSMVEHMQRLQLSPNERETIVIEDWFTYLPSVSDPFDVILSDLTQSNIPYELRHEFYRGVASALAVGGHFIDRIYKFDNPTLCVPLHSIADTIRSSAGFDLVAMNEVLYSLLISDKVVEQGIADLETLYRELIAIDNHPKVHRATEFLQEYLAPGSVTWLWGRPWDEVVAEYSGSLILTSETRRTDPLRRGFPCLQTWTRSTGAISSDLGLHRNG
jgi:hypothetical protein